MIASEHTNVIILTTGLAGSSVLAGLLGRAGYWMGQDTFSKDDYRTYENIELIKLNQRLFAAAEYRGNYEMVFDSREICLFRSETLAVDIQPFEAFIDDCNANGPWLWKDPRLWLTMWFWIRLLDVDNVRFVVLTREPMQSWISSTLRRQIQTPAHCRRYIDGINGSIKGFLSRYQLPALEIVYEDLLLDPEKEIARLNQFLKIQLGVDDLRSVFKGELGKRQRGIADLVRASVVYAVNFGQRYR